ncbi:AsnC family transcriptional regulator [Methylobacter sp. Wu8]|uniref:siroheme decarboxylase n=1 Tax=Methylobacter tundripaludum TaxID=173365 RepID=A0A2S6GRL3_9GAMM|nr:AsnC family transcriptional regulator [Methylobacter tundripaludum]MCF7965489.1 Lrp/AsnC family transcriptional regulator [Methylobacter tundripaludum]MCK9635836.1 Lrp/AsnC family transcriptional regulator [Methylobacter tundripaludum]PPK67761.1 AsnC family transcriptional regulator [Methylobacter tundripaludum]
MDEIDKKIINALQNGFPICDAPYRQVAVQLGLTEQELIARLKALLDNGVLTRFGPLYNAEQMGGALTLAAVKAPQQRFDEITEIINSFPEVAHNYARSHELNMWFVIATETPEQIRQTVSAIEQQTGLTVYNMPKNKEYFVNLKLEA